MYSEADLDFATDDDVRGAMRRLEGYVDDPDFELRQQACGFRFEPHGLLMQCTGPLTTSSSQPSSIAMIGCIV